MYAQCGLGVFRRQKVVVGCVALIDNVFQTAECCCFEATSGSLNFAPNSTIIRVTDVHFVMVII
jgi:hypothetical protein